MTSSGIGVCDPTRPVAVRSYCPPGSETSLRMSGPTKTAESRNESNDNTTG